MRRGIRGDILSVAIRGDRKQRVPGRVSQSGVALENHAYEYFNYVTRRSNIDVHLVSFFESIVLSTLRRVEIIPAFVAEIFPGEAYDDANAQSKRTGVTSVLSSTTPDSTSIVSPDHHHSVHRAYNRDASQSLPSLWRCQKH